jgi:PAS domain S-box-containing protein
MPPIDPTLARDLLQPRYDAMSPAPAEQILQLVPIAIHVCDAAGRLTFSNRAAAELLGRAPAIGAIEERYCGCYQLHRPDGTLIPPAETPMAIALREGRTIRDFEARLARPDASTFLASISVDPIREADGHVAGSINVFQDITQRMAVEERLRSRETELQLIRASAPVSLSHWDAEHRLIFASRAFSERWRATPEELVGKGMSDIFGGPAVEMMQPYLARILQGETVEYEMEVPYAAIGRRFVRVASVPEIDPTGRVRGYLSAVVDLTERRATENALRETSERLRLAMRAGKLGLWDWDIASDRVTWTDSLYVIHGVTRDQFDGSSASFNKLVHPDERVPVQRAIQSALEHDVPYELEFRAVRPGGAVVWLFTNAVIVHDEGRAVRMVGATLDITARKSAELALRESESRFRTLASNAPVGIFLTDTSGDCVFVNEAWRFMSGLSPDEARGKGWDKAIHPDDRERVLAEWYAAAQEQRPFALEYRMQRPDGTVFWLEGSAVTSRNAAGASTGYIGIVVDITERKIAEDKLRESEKRFRTLASHAPVGIFLTDAEGDTLFVNEAWTRMSELSVEQARGRDWINAVHPDDRERVIRGWEDAARRGAASKAEYRFLRPDGSITWVQGNAVQLYDEANRPAGYIGTIVDVTERKVAEEKLRAQEAQLRLISTNAPIMLTHCSRANRYLFANRAYSERFGLEPDQIIGRRIADVIGEEALAVIRPYVDRVLAGESLSYEAEVPYAIAGPRYMRIAYAPDIASDGTVQGWLSAISDVSDKKHAEDALRRLAAIIESTDDAIFSRDLDGLITSWNKGAERMFGYTAEETVGKPALLLIPPDRYPEANTILDRVRQGERFEHFDTIRRRKDGSLINISLTVSPLMNSAGEAVGASIIGRDITQQKRDAEALSVAQRKLQAHADELEQKVQERTASLREAIVQMEEFSYSVSHDLRAPLRAMNAYAEALAEDYTAQLDATARDYLARIQRSSRRMEKLTHDVLNYSRVARDEAILTSVDVEALLDDLISQYSELQVAQADVEISRPLLRVRGHESALGQCLANLLNNAVKFVEPGKRPVIRVRTEAIADRVQIWIEDNGIGIPPENQAKLFRVFERVPSRHQYDGTGIGLAIVRKAAEKMGGRCGMESDGESGSRFWIELAKG